MAAPAAKTVATTAAAALSPAAAAAAAALQVTDLATEGGIRILGTFIKKK